ncbi:unnamed protein product [Arctogadus glacialis]
MTYANISFTEKTNTPLHGRAVSAAPYRQPPTASPLPAAPYRQPPTASPLPAAPYRQPPTGRPLPAAPYRQPPTGRPLPAPYRQPPTGSPLPAAPYRQPPTGRPIGELTANRQPSPSQPLISLSEAVRSVCSTLAITAEGRPGVSRKRREAEQQG